jgi:dolichol kinase
VELRISKSELLRKAFHLSLLAALPLHTLSYEVAVLGGVALCIGYALAEFLRHLKIKVILVHRPIRICARPNEKYVVSPFFLLFSVTMLLLIFPTPMAYPALLAATLGDAIATLVGLTIGRTKIYQEKTLEGSLAMFVATFLSSTLFVDVKLAWLAASAATLIELPSGDYDNLTVPFGTVFILKFLKL